MGFAFNSIKEDKGKAIVQTARNYQIEADVTRFVEYYNSKEYQTALFEKFCFEENKIEKKETYRNKM